MLPTNKRPLFSAFVIAAISLASPLLSSSAHANLVLNGGFEAAAVDIYGGNAGVGGTAIGGGNATFYEAQDGLGHRIIPNWNIGPSTSSPNAIASNQNIYYATASNGDPGAANGGPHSGVLAAVFPNGFPYDGYISQAIAGVVAGQTYRISYWLSNQIGDFPNNSLRVNWGGTDTGTAITSGTDIYGPVALTVPLNWTQYTMDVVATVNNERLSFIAGNDAAGNLLDDVSVVAVPEVSSFGMLTGIALLACGTAARFRRRSVATA